MYHLLLQSKVSHLCLEANDSPPGKDRLDLIESDPVQSILQSLDIHEHDFPHDKETEFAWRALPFSKSHHSKVDNVLADFLCCLASYPNDKWTKHLRNVTYQSLDSELWLGLMS